MNDTPSHTEDYANLAERFAPRKKIINLPSVEAVLAVEQALKVCERHPLLAEREPTHGDFSATALIAQRFKDISKSTPNWSGNLTDVQREALESIFTKIARILSGDPNHKDHWSDIAGGAHLVEERL
jgi:hypothetical protein